MKRSCRRGALLLGAVVLTSSLAACSGSSGSSQASAQERTASRTTVAGFRKADWAGRITVNYRKNSIRFRASGIPNHSRSAYYAVGNGGSPVPTPENSSAVADPTQAQNYDYSIPNRPVWRKTVTSAPLGSIGFMISGATLFNPYEGDGTTVAMQNNFSVAAPGGGTAPFVDDCSGHPTPQMGGAGGLYHYHALPGCVTSQVDTGTGPSHIIGIAFDGYPIYGNRNIRGQKVSVSKLDRCNGIKSATPEFPKGIYHYVLPGTSNATSSIRCFHGRVDSDLISPMPPMGGGEGMPPGPPPGGVGSQGGAVPLGSLAHSFVCDLVGRA